MRDYQQPDFFRFGDDALFLVQEVSSAYQGRKISHLVDLGAGSGILALELAQRLAIERMTLVEAQKDFWPSLTANVQKYYPAAASINENVSAFRVRSIKADLVVCNPPYFLPTQGLPSQDPRRDMAHRFVSATPAQWCETMVTILAPGGEVWFLEKEEHLHKIFKQRGFKTEARRRAGVFLYRACPL